jgi:2-polyprenyl-3-methyl-5-hydroxy-6-metoxy-1,4-benzoquinol methylase
MSNLTQHEREKYQEAWSLDVYTKTSPGADALPLFLDMAGPLHGAKVLDAGCGEGKGTDALIAAGFLVTACDFVVDAYKSTAPFYEWVLWERPSNLRLLDGQFDYIYCCDVLEHIPTALTGLVITRLVDLAERGVFLTISNVQDVMGLWVGTPLHQTVQPFVWWRDLLDTVAEVREARDLLNSSAFFVRAR